MNQHRDQLKEHQGGNKMKYLLSSYEGAFINGRKCWELVWYDNITEEITREKVYEQEVK